MKVTPFRTMLRTRAALICALSAAAVVVVVLASPLWRAPPEAGAQARSGGTERSPGGDAVAELPLYERDYPAVGYTRVAPSDPVARLVSRIEHGEAHLTLGTPRGHLDSLLAALDIDPASQTLVFSATSLQTRAVRPRTPRALYFNDAVYVAWVQGGGAIELAAMDPRLGPVFYTLEQADGATLERATDRCLRCHDSQSMQGGGVPRFLIGSGYIGTRGNIVAHEGWILTTQRTPLRNRFGGWYVTGQHGDQVHLGNIVVHDTAALGDLESLRRGNLVSLDGLVDTAPYARRGSDIVALLVLQHQIDVQNEIARVGFELRQALADSNSALPSSRIETLVEPLVEAMLFVGVPVFTAPISGDPAFIERFERRGPKDAHGRSLRDVDLQHRLMRYPLSYLIYSEAFAALPAAAREASYRRFAAVLNGHDRDAKFAHLTDDDRAAVRAIVRATHDELGAVLGSFAGGAKR